MSASPCQPLLSGRAQIADKNPRFPNFHRADHPRETQIPANHVQVVGSARSGGAVLRKNFLIASGDRSLIR